MWAMNTQKFYDAITHGRRQIHSIVFEAFMDLVNDHLQYEDDGRYVCNSYQLKRWLWEFGNGYEALNRACEELRVERQAAKER